MQYYTLDNWMLLQSRDYCLVTDPELMEVLEKEEHSPEYMQTTHMLKVFPQATARVKELLKEAQRAGAEADIKRYRQMLYWKRALAKGGLVDISKARQRPISEFIEFNQANLARCIFHNEKTPSMKYYPEDNHVHCFGCGKSADVIDVVRQLNQCSFREALKILS